MTVLYDDKRIILDDDAITIMGYYFPMGARRIAYRDILAYQELSLSMWTGRWRVWGSGDMQHWFNLDPARPRKHRAIILETGGWFQPVITPDNPDMVVEILQQRVSHMAARVGRGQYDLGQGQQGQGQNRQGQFGQGQYGQGQSGQGETGQPQRGQGQFGQGQFGQGQFGQGQGNQGTGQSGMGQGGQISGSGQITGSGGQLVGSAQIGGSTSKTGMGSSGSSGSSSSTP